MLNLFYDCYCILNKVYSEDSFIKQAMVSTQIEEKNRPAVTKICYGVLDRDIYLTDCIDRLCDKKPKLVIRTILKIAMYNLHFLNKAPYAVTNTAVELCNKLGKRGVSGFVNAFLRKYIKMPDYEPQDEYLKLSLKYDYPLFAVSKLVDAYGIKRARSIMAAEGEQTCLRFNNTDGEKYLKNKNINYVKTPYNNSYFASKFVRDKGYDEGLYTYQSIGSQAICGAISGKGVLLDACAAPGGKSVLLADIFDKVIAQEIHPHRVELIKEYVFRMKKNNVDVVLGDATVNNSEFVDKFDAVLCDVPCSGFGVIKNNPDIKLKKTEQSIAEIAKTQYQILSNCASYVKLGGVLCYSTCSVFKEENDDVIREFIYKNSQFTLDIISVKIPYLKTDFGVQILPDDAYGAGFYLSLLRRKK